MSHPKHYDVIIVGCGPIGAFVANLFGQLKLNALVVEQEIDPYPLPRAVHFDHEIMRLIQSVGLAERFMPLIREARGHIHVGADGGVIRYLGTFGLHKRFGWANDYFFFQPEFERVMREGATRFSTVDFRFGSSVVAVEPCEVGVHARIRVGDNEREREVTARFLIACDGASSPVRKMLGISLNDLDFDEPWLVVDMEVDGPISWPDFHGVPKGADLQQLSVMLCDPKRPSTLVPGRGIHRRWEFMLLPGEDEQAMMQPDKVNELITPWVKDTPSRFIRAATYRFHGLVANRWKEGCVFLAGDAAHQTPPFFGQGMCHGMRDVANLAWKIDLILKDKADPTLLETYQAEREPHVRTVVDAAIAAGRYICELDPQIARERDIGLREKMKSPAPSSAGDLIPPIREGVVSFTGAGRAGVGDRFIQPEITVGDADMLLDDATGGGFVVLGAEGFDIEQLEAGKLAFFKAIGGKLFVLGGQGNGISAARAIGDKDGDLQRWLDEKQAKVVIIRPDFYVFGLASSPAELNLLLGELQYALSRKRFSKAKEAMRTGAQA
jgi:3-(3-hydroxy-phenyl)propionate hydroxylase